ncbi:MAG: hypothetical protein IPK64_15035 [bacterium]|nr:hypothetical protein [bacterium]
MKTTHRILLLGLIAALAIACSGCTAKISQLKLVSVNDVDIEQKYTLVAQDVSAKTSSLWFLVYLGLGDISYYPAIGDCLAEHNGDLMTDVRVTTSSFYFVIGTYTEYRVRGNVWRRVDPTATASLAAEEIYTLAQLEQGTCLVSADGRDIRPATQSQ